MRVVGLFFFLVSSVSAQSWLPLGDFPGSGRDDAASFVLDGGFYVGTGVNGSFGSEFDFYRLDLQSLLWSQAPGLPADKRRQYASTAVNSQGQAFLIGGLDGMLFYDDVWVFSPDLAQWTQVGTCPFGGRSGMASFVLADTVYVLGGKTSQTNNSTEVWAMSMTTFEWIQKRDLPFGGRWRSSAAADGRYGYLTFGRTTGGGYDAELHRYDPTTDSWETIATFPESPRVYSSMISQGSSLILIFGIDREGITHGDLWSIDLTDMSWSQGNAQLNPPRRGGCAALVLGKLVYTTGIDAQNSRLVQTHILDLGSGLSEQKFEDNKIIARYFDLMGREVSGTTCGWLVEEYSSGERKLIFKP